MKHRNFLGRQLPIVLTVILIVAAGLVIYFAYPRNKDKRIDGIAGTIDTTTPHPSDVMIRFEREYNGTKYHDGLNFTQKEYDALTRDQIIKMEDERFNNWVIAITQASQGSGPATSTDTQ